MENHLQRIIIMLTKNFVYALMINLLTFTVIFADNAVGQDLKSVREVSIDLNLKSAGLKDVFNAIEKQTTYKFAFDQTVIDEKVSLDLIGKDKLVSDYLLEISEQTNLKFRQVNYQITVNKIKKKKDTKLEVIIEGKTITGRVTDSEDGEGLPGVNVIVKGTIQGTVTDVEGNFKLDVPGENSILVFSSVGYVQEELVVGSRTVIDLKMIMDITSLEEIVVLGYGTQKKIHLTASVSQVGSEVMENRPVSNTSQALQGRVANLAVNTTTAGGEPGAALNLNIRGFVTSGGSGNVRNASPLVLVDNVEQDLDRIDPEDIESIAVLKDAAAASIYGSRAAAGAIIITTKSGKNSSGGIKVNYSNNFQWSQPTIWPKQANAVDYAYTMNDAAKNAGRNPLFTDQELEWIGMNLENPGSAPTLVPNEDSLRWDQGAGGLGGSAATDWREFLFKDWASRQKHSISLSGGEAKLNYYVSGNFYNEGGLTTVGNEKYKRYTIDAKINSKATDWLTLSLLTKFNKTASEFPWDFQYGRGRMFDLLTKIKPTLPTVDPIFGEPLIDAWYPKWSTQRDVSENNQVLILPRVIIEPVKDWLINLEYNYRRNNNYRQYSALQYEYKRPNGESAFTPTREQTQVRSNLYTNEYYSPNLYSSYTKKFGGHNFKILVGYQSELYKSFNMTSKAVHLLTDNVPSISTSVGEQTVDDAISHWATQSLFGSFNYNYQDKYLLEVSYRRDGSSKFEPGNQWADFSSISAGYNIANEDFWLPLQNIINVFKLRGSYGTLGNQNVSNYLYVPRIGISQGNYLFNDQWSYIANPPSLASVNLTWEKVKTMDFGLDIIAFKDRLTLNLDWYRTDITDMAARGAKVPAVLGTSAPLTNNGITRVQGWEIETRWRESIGDFGYNVGLVLSDYKRSIVEYPNPTNLLSQNYAGKDLGEIWGLEWDGWFQSKEEVKDYPINQSYVRGGTWTPGDTKYVDQNGDGVIDRGINTIDDHGDFVVIGNSTPRYQYGVTLGANWKGIDFSMFIQGVGKRDLNIQNSAFRGPAIGPFHSNVMEEHLDYWRDETSPLGANPDAYFPKPYSQNPGNNNRNYRFPVDRYLQDASYVRLKSLQIGYSLPKEMVNKVLMSRVRIFVAGENLFTKTNLILYDPEVTNGSWGVGKAYPLSKVISTGLNITF